MDFKATQGTVVLRHGRKILLKKNPLGKKKKKSDKSMAVSNCQVCDVVFLQVLEKSRQ